jgi:hypothetical protein
MRVNVRRSSPSAKALEGEREIRQFGAIHPQKLTHGELILLVVVCLARIVMVFYLLDVLVNSGVASVLRKDCVVRVRKLFWQ